MKILFVGMLSLAFSPMAFSQEAVSIGAKTSYLVNANQNTHGLNVSWLSKDGIYFPVSVELGSGIRKATAGIGLNNEVGDLLTHNIAVALGNINFDPEFDLLDNKRANRTVFLLQNELNFQLSRNVTLGVHLDLDVFNWANTAEAGEGLYEPFPKSNYPELLNTTHQRTVDANGNPAWISNYTGELFYPDYASKADYQAARSEYEAGYSSLVERAKDQSRFKSMSSFGLSLKIDILKGKKRSNY